MLIRDSISVCWREYDLEFEQLPTYSSFFCRSAAQRKKTRHHALYALSNTSMYEVVRCVTGQDQRGARAIVLLSLRAGMVDIFVV